jgi:hypothetical protein
MNAHRNYTIAHLLKILAFVGAIIGLLMVSNRAEGVIVPLIILIGSVLIGLTASIMAAYYKSHEKNPETQQKVALETLAKIGKEKRWHS